MIQRKHARPADASFVLGSTTFRWAILTCGSSCGQEKRSQLILYTVEAGSCGGPASCCCGCKGIRGEAEAAAALAASAPCHANGVGAALGGYDCRAAALIADVVKSEHCFSKGHVSVQQKHRCRFASPLQR